MGQINILAELQRLHYKYEPCSENEVKVLCPCHEDTHPSAFINTTSQVWYCQTCKAKGDFISFMCHILKASREALLIELSSRYDLKEVRTISPDVIEKFHTKIWTAGPLLKELYNRGITDDDIRLHRLGYNEGRIIIPIYDDAGRIVNLRKYLPGAPASEKMRNMKGYKASALYPANQLKYDILWICGGEMKAIVAARILNEKRIGAVCVTSSEGTWNREFSEKIKGKVIYNCMDVDKAGLDANRKIAIQQYHFARTVKTIALPLDKDKYPKGDINDWVGHEGATIDDFMKAMQDAVPFLLPTDDEPKVEDEIEVKLSEAALSENIGKRITFEALISAMDENPYLIPKDINVSCTKDQPDCTYCPVYAKTVSDSGFVKLEIKGNNPGILEMINTPSKLQKDIIKSSLKIPSSCKVCEFQIISRHDLLDIRMTPVLQISGDNKDHVVQPAYVIGRGLDLNSPYVFSGRVFPSPKTQQSILLIDTVKQGQDTLSTFEIEDYNSLKVFCPDEWTKQSVEKKLFDVYQDLETNVTQIFKRHELHLLIDLTYHSCLYYEFDGRLQNGWVNSLILGDSSQGKSEASSRMQIHYGLGTRHDCKNATSAGLLGGLQQMGSTRWFITWGVIPINDRRLVILEEIKGTDYDVLSRLTDMRSSGYAEISKIEKRKAHARTRLIMISNPRSDRPVAAYNFGIEAIKELMGSLEDVRRFDLAVVMSSTQINSDEINKLRKGRPEVPHKYTSELCKKLVLWAWTRQANQIRFDPEAITLCLDKATLLCNKFSEALPLCDRGTMRYKIARLALALACRTFSADDKNNDIVLVRPCHIEYIAYIIDKLYSDPVFGYADFSLAQEFANKVCDADLVKGKLLNTKYPKDVISQLLYKDEICLIDIQDWCELDKDAAQKVLSFLVRKHALYRVKNVYIKTGEFISILKQMEKSGNYKQEKNCEQF